MVFVKSLKTLTETKSFNEYCFISMKILNHLLFFVVLGAYSPVSAVDYLQCREMLRTKNEMTENVVKIEADYKSNFRNSIVVPEAACPLGQEWNSFSSKLVCEQNYKDKLVGERKPVATSPGGTKFYTNEGYKWYKSAVKVQVDMKKAQCPYE